MASLNTDILREICQQLALYPPSTPSVGDIHGVDPSYGAHEIEKHNALANAALTCRVFADLASEVLWAVLPDGVFPLLKTFSNLKRRQREKIDQETSRRYREAYYVSNMLELWC